MGDYLHNLPQYLSNGLVVGCLYALVAMGFNIIFSSTGVINFAQGEFAMFGGLLTYTFAGPLGLPVPLAALAAIIVTALIGAAMERLVIFPLRGSNVLNMIIATIGASILFKALGRTLWPEDGYQVPVFTSGSFNIFGVNQNKQVIWILSLTVVAVLLTYVFFQRTKTGKAMRACSINRQAASLVGVNVSRMSLYAFVISAALAGAAGFINAPAARYDMGLALGISGFTAAVIGGLGNPFGAVLGGILLGLAENLMSGFLQVVLGISSGYGEALVPLLLILVLLLKPQGVLGGREKIRV